VRLLLDTQALLWILVDDPRLNERARRAITDPLNDVFVSAATAWEIAIKSRLGKLKVPPDIGAWLPEQLASNRMTPLAITLAHAAEVEHLPAIHMDPFDRVLIAQARAENLTLVTSDRQFDGYDVRLLRCN
jgi:PIN domain nuclease of toxin-antitoxin system